MIEQHFTCPQCGKTFPVLSYEVIDTGKDPSMKEKVRTGEAFAASCHFCGWHTRFDYSFLYWEEDTKTLIYYANSKELYEAAYRRMTGRTGGADWESIKSWKRRVVTSRNDLLEKLLILDGGLDDRIIEIMKGLAFVSLKQNRPTWKWTPFFSIKEMTEIIISVSAKKKKWKPPMSLNGPCMKKSGEAFPLSWISFQEEKWSSIPSGLQEL